MFSQVQIILLVFSRAIECFLKTFCFSGTNSVDEED